MKSGNNSIMRVETLINNDRMRSNNDFCDLLTMDLNRVLSDYFDHKEYPVVGISKNGSSYSVTVTLNADGIKAFKRLPKDGAD